MGHVDGMQPSLQRRIRVGGRLVDYRLVQSTTVRKLRIRVGPSGIEVLQPATRDELAVAEFLAANASWVLDQLDRVEKMRSVCVFTAKPFAEISLRGNPTTIRIESTGWRGAGNTVRYLDGEIVVSRGPCSRTVVARSLERWLRREARRGIEQHLAAVAGRLGQRPRRVYIMDQRTKWGNCSPRKNLSFNWRLILAPDYVLRYLVTHEATHLAVPDHSAKFWLTVQSLCPETERARQWLCRYQSRLQVDLDDVLATVPSGPNMRS